MIADTGKEAARRSRGLILPLGPKKCELDQKHSRDCKLCNIRAVFQKYVEEEGNERELDSRLVVVV